MVSERRTGHSRVGGRRLPERVYRRRRRIAATLAVAALSAGLAALEAALSEPIHVDALAAPTGTAAAECTDPSAAALRRRLGQRLVVRMESEATPVLRRQAARGEIGGVILFPPPGTDPEMLQDEIAKLQRAATEAGEPRLIVATDQEGGEVKRFADLPPAEAPPEIAEMGAAAAREQGAAAGRALARLGINVDLAPVLDVPATPDSFLAARSFGTTPDAVAEAGSAFASGLSDGGVAATAKHFPGLGRSIANTDLEPSALDASEADLRADLEPFERSIAAGIPLVMLANASYPALDGRVPAFASPPIATGLLREELGFTGVSITDDLEAGAVRARFDRARAARRAIGGGTDLLLFAQTSKPGVLDDLVRAAQRGELVPAALEESCARVRALRGSAAG